MTPETRRKTAVMMAVLGISGCSGAENGQPASSLFGGRTYTAELTILAPSRKVITQKSAPARTIEQCLSAGPKFMGPLVKEHGAMRVAQEVMEAGTTCKDNQTNRIVATQTCKPDAGQPNGMSCLQTSASPVPGQPGVMQQPSGGAFNGLGSNFMSRMPRLGL